MGRRLQPRPAPDAAELRSLTVHEVVRDYPETLAVLRRLGMDVRAVGGRRLEDLPDGSGAVDALLDATGWRPAHP